MPGVPPRLRMVSLATVVVLLGAACGGGTTDGTPTTPPTTTSPSTTTPAPTQTVTPTSTATSRTTAPPGKRTIALPSGGPTDDVLPPDDDPYALLSAGDCRGLLRMVKSWEGLGVPDQDYFLYLSAQEICSLNWQAAQRDVQGATPSPSTSERDCPKRTVFLWVQDRLKEYAQHPSATWTVPVAMGTSSPAPTTTRT